MTRNFILNSILFLCLMHPVCPAQDGGRPLQDAAVVEMLTSPYEVERGRGVKSLVDMVAQATDPVVAMRGWLGHEDELVRFGAACAAPQIMTIGDTLKGITGVIASERLVTRRIRLGEIMFAAAFRSWDGSQDYFDGREELPELPAAAVLFTRKKLVALAESATLTTDFATLGRFAALGPYARRALELVIQSRSDGAAPRALALSALARMDAPDYWLAPDGALSATVCRMLEDETEHMKINVLFSLAYYGCRTPASIRAVSEFVLKDAYSAETIQAGLYFLYTQPDEVIRREMPILNKVAAEYLDTSYAQKVRYNAGLLLNRLNVAPLVEKTCTMIREAPDFASYWALAALLNHAADLPENSRAEIIKTITDWALTSAECAPQLKALAAWHKKENSETLPDGCTLEGLSAEVRASIEKVYARTEDPSHLAIRSGLDILAYLKDPQITKPLRKALEHESEAVRMAAGMAAGATGNKELVPDLVKAMADPYEYAAFGAAWGLRQLDAKAAVAWFARYLFAGNACLMPSSLEGLRALTGKQVAEDVPGNPGAWRARGRAWRKLLAKPK